MIEGSAQVRAQRFDAAMSALDEAMLMVTSGALSPIATGMIFCTVIACCQRAYALDRSREWTLALSAWCAAQPQLVTFTGSCQLHRAQILELGGAWNESIEQAERCVQTSAVVAGDALYQKAEIHRLRGELAEAEASYREASQRGRDPQPGFALLRLSQGEPALAAGAVRAALSACAEPLERARFLPASVEILLASGALEEAAGAADELQAYAGRLGGEALHAIAGEARARIALARGDATTALAPLRSAFATWQKLDAPYIAARLRAQIACACEALGDVEGARLEREAARAAFERLGARLDLAALEIPTIGIGAGPHCDGQVLVMHDILGLAEYAPPFAKVYAPVGEQMIKAFENYADEVRSGKFPPDTES
jgi:hypothetical protein